MISVVIPVLNGEKYIRPCLESVLSQNIKDIEVIVVDGGSNDGTLQIIKNFIEKDLRIRLLQSSKKSYGAQMNLGISNVKGEYFAILEADDILPQNAYEILLNKIKCTGADLVKGNYKNFVSGEFENIITIPTDIFQNKQDIYDKEITAKKYAEIIRKDRYVWCGLYDIDFIRKNNIWFNETPGAAFQDNGFLIQTLILANKVVYIKDYVYFYRKDNDGSSVYSPKGYKYIADEYSFIMEFLNRLSVEERLLYLPQIFLTIMDLVRTRSLLRATLNNASDVSNYEDINRIIEILGKGLDASVIGYDLRFQKDLFEMALFCENPKLYLKYTQKEIDAERHDVECFFNRILNANKIYVWGYGKTGAMFRALLHRKMYAGKIVWSDIVAKNEDDINVINAHTLASEYSGDGIYVICSEDHRYEIRDELHNRYGVPYSNILFYTIGTSQQLFFM